MYDLSIAFSSFLFFHEKNRSKRDIHVPVSNFHFLKNKDLLVFFKEKKFTCGFTYPDINDMYHCSLHYWDTVNSLF